MLPWLLVRIGTATSVEGKLEKTVVQESNSISEKNVMGTKLPHYSMEDWLSKSETIPQASQKNS